MMHTIPLLAAATILPVIASAALYLAERKTAFSRAPERFKQAVAGVVFGALAVFGTEFGIPISGAVINVRDAAPLCAGLLFGAPAGILAGVIGGVERWLAVLWGAGSYTRLACTLGTIMAGVIGAVLRRYLFDNKKPAWYYGFAVGIVTEILHLLLVFLTNMDDPQTAFIVVRQCALPMISCNGISVMLATLTVSLMGRERPAVRDGRQKISQTFQRWLLACVAVAFGVTSLFTFILQSNLARSDAENLLTLNMQDVCADLRDTSDQNLLIQAHRVSAQLAEAEKPSYELLLRLCALYDISEINIVDSNGIITASTESGFMGYDMAGGKQSAAFLVLTQGERELVQEYQPISYQPSTWRKYAGVSLPDGGFVQIGYDAERFQNDIAAQVKGITENRHVGKSGSILVADAGWMIVSDPGGGMGKNLAVAGVWIDTETMAENTRFQCEVYGVPCHCMYTSTEGYYIVAALPVSEASFFRDISVYISMFMEVLVFAMLFLLIYVLIKKLVVENIHRINGALAQITGGNLDVAVDVRSNEEFASLSDDINSTVMTLKRYIAEAAARIDQELEFAKVIQSSTLPSQFPPFPGRTDLDIFARMDTAKEVGGDFYDFYLLEDNRLAFLIADVSGKGISAAMFMMTAKTLIKTIAEKESDAAKILMLANEELCRGNEAGMFVTCWLGILNTETNTVRFAVAGHNPPLVRHGDGDFTYFSASPGFVLGGMGGVRYRGGELTLAPGDTIFLYTDGVTEATDNSDELYGDDRLSAVLNANPGDSARELCDAVKRDVDAFVGSAPQFDDITMLCLRRENTE